MKQYTIYGNPIEHSKSPQMHNAGFNFLNIDSNYSKTLLKDGNNIKNEFLKNNISGANITVPFKVNAFKNADILDEFALKIGAVNTYINDNGQIKAYNTDAHGFYKAIKEFVQIKSVLLLGAGGTAKAIAVILKSKNIKVTILNRSQNNRDFFINLGCKFYDYDSLRLFFSGGGAEFDYDLIVNSTSAGLKDDNYPAPLELLKPALKNALYAFDCIYGKQTSFLKIAKKYNLKHKNGEDMLLHQGVIAFELFTNTKATDKLIEAMRQGLKSS
jgi:shikimate dehydrogenase